jgi:GNAT superfamily N-acetyltransferase
MNTSNGITLITVDHTSLPKARDLVNQIFPHQSPLERISLWLFGKRGTCIYRILSAIAGADLLVFWLAEDAQGQALGISGLYCTRKDREEALWLGWYGVHPDARGRGVGGMLLRHAIAEAEAKGANYLRLYTAESEYIEGSDDAQTVYEKYGLKVKARKRIPGGFTISKEGIRIVWGEKIIRELRLRSWNCYDQAGEPS